MHGEKMKLAPTCFDITIIRELTLIILKTYSECT